MLSYVGRFWSAPKPVTRLEQFPESAKFLPAIENVRAKTEEFARATVNATASELVQKKFAILNRLMNAINRSIDEFNANVKKNYLDDLKEAIKLIAELRDLVFTKLSGDDFYILSLQQDGSNNTTTGLELAAKAVTAPLVTEVLPSIGAQYLYHPAKRKMKQWYGVDPDKTASILLLEALHDGLIAAHEELNRKFRAQQCTIEFSDDDRFPSASTDNAVKCSLTGKPAKDPVRCKLDGSVYEREAIVDYLLQHRKSPGNGKPMPQGEPISAVLQEDAELKAFLSDRPEHAAFGMGSK